jgi:hypothetical protein
MPSGQFIYRTLVAASSSGQLLNSAQLLVGSCFGLTQYGQLRGCCRFRAGRGDSEGSRTDLDPIVSAGSGNGSGDFSLALPARNLASGIATVAGIVP